MIQYPTHVFLLFAFLASTTSGPTESPLVSDQVGVYGRIVRVVFHPDAKNPKTAETVKLFGAFAIAEAKNGNSYRSPQWGSLTYHLDPENTEKCRAQWADLQSVAGTGSVVGFGFRYYQRGIKVVAAGDKDIPSAKYNSGMGVQKTRNAQYAPLWQLHHLPRPLSPAGGDSVTCQGGYPRGQTIEFTCENCAADGDDVRYIFDVEQANGDMIASKPIPAGDGKTTWRTSISIAPDRRVTWRVRVIADGLEAAPVARASFVPRAPKKRGKSGGTRKK